MKDGSKKTYPVNVSLDLIKGNGFPVTKTQWY